MLVILVFSLTQKGYTETKKYAGMSLRNSQKSLGGIKDK